MEQFLSDDIRDILSSGVEAKDNDKYIYRLDLSSIEVKALLNIFEQIQSNKQLQEELEYLIKNKQIFKQIKKLYKSSKKQEAMRKATEHRSTIAKEKINNAINILRMENKNISIYSLSKTSGVAYNTIKKYISKELLEDLNK